MKLSIIPSDGAVYKDGVSYANLDLSSVPEDVHALQWDRDSGWIEFKDESEFRKPPNKAIAELPKWANDALAKWEEVEAARTAAIQAAANQPQPYVQGAQDL